MAYNEIYADEPQIAFEGQIADTSPATIVSRTVVGGNIGFGRPVALGDADHTVEAVAADSTAIYGITVRSQATKAENANVYPENDTAAILLKGAIWVKVNEAVTHGAAVTFDSGTGGFGVTAPGAGVLAVAGAIYETSAAANGLARIRIA